MMKRLAIFLLLIITAPAALCQVTAKAYRSYLPDEIIPLELADPCVPHKYRDIMVGTKLAIVISSDTAVYAWYGSLKIDSADPNGALYGRGPDAFELYDSVLPAAGVWGCVDTMDEENWFDTTADGDPEIGDWFVFDYNAVAIGDCNVSLYDYGNPPAPPPSLIYGLEFSHVITRDFDDSGQVNFVDFSTLASWWNNTSCSQSENCGGCDLDTNGQVDVNDIRLFTEFWLEKTR